MKKIPVTIITGFLGSGKTTILNHLLRDPRLTDTAVIVNEFGEIGLDHLLVESAIDQIVLMDNGCLCCSVRGDLVDTLEDLLRRVDDGSIQEFKQVMIETTGLAEPAPIVQTLVTDEAIADRFELNGIVTAVDSMVGVETLATYDEARCQVAMADILLLTKTDMKDANEEGTRKALHDLNPQAEVILAENGGVDPEILLNIGADNLSSATAVAPHVHHHDDHGSHIWNIHSASIVFDEPLPWSLVSEWLEWLTALRGPDVLRIKGLLRIEGFDGPVLIHGVQHVFHPPQVLSDWPDSDTRSRLVLITRDIPESALRASLEAFKRNFKRAA